MTTLRVRFPYKEWPGWDVPECTLTAVQLPNTSDPPRKIISATVDPTPLSDYSSDSPVFKASLVDHSGRKVTVALKFSLREDLIPSLAEEACAYVGPMKSLQGKTIPLCYGLYAGTPDDRDGRMIACLVLEFWGQCLRQPFRKLSLNLKLRILDQLAEMHKCGFHHGDFAERNILERNGDVRFIDFDEMTEHDCRCSMTFRPNDKTPDVNEFGCPHLWQVCCYTMKIWDLCK